MNRKHSIIDGGFTGMVAAIRLGVNVLPKNSQSLPPL